MKTSNFQFHVALLGERSVGKAAIIKQFTKDDGFSELSGNGDKTIEVNGTRVNLSLCFYDDNEKREDAVKYACFSFLFPLEVNQTPLFFHFLMFR